MYREIEIKYKKIMAYFKKRVHIEIREIHEQLLSGVRGQEKNPGEFRKSQNWIGAANCSLKEARYIPPNVEDMNQAMDELERYMNEGDDYDPLIRIALME